MTFAQDIVRVAPESPLEKHARFVAEHAEARRKHDDAQRAASKARATGKPDPLLERLAWLAGVEHAIAEAVALASWTDLYDWLRVTA